jgi:hypothetical protein
MIAPSRLGRRALLLRGAAACLAAGEPGRSDGKTTTMKTERCVLEVKVLNHWLIQRFSGQAILAAVKPRFVVALLAAGSAGPFAVADSGVTLTAHRVVFLAVGSIVKVFAETDVIGKDYRLTVEQHEEDGKKSYTVAVEG